MTLAVERDVKQQINKYTLWTTPFSYHRTKFICTCSLLSGHAHGLEIRVKKNLNSSSVGRKREWMFRRCVTRVHMNLEQ